MTKLLEIPYVGIQNLIETIHFNPHHPENHNVKIPNRKEKFAVVKNNGSWELRNKHAVIDDMVDNGYNILDGHYDEGKKVLTAKKNKTFRTFQSKFENTSDNLKKTICAEAELIVLNLSKKNNDINKSVLAS